MPVWCTLALKDLRLLARDRVGLFWVLGFPLVFATFFGSVLRAAVEDRVAPLQVVVVEGPDTPGPERADRLALQLVVSGVEVLRASEAQAREQVRRGRLTAFVRVAPEAAGPVEIGIDPMRRAEGAMLRGLVLRALAPEYIPLALTPPAVAVQPVLGRRPGRPGSGYELVFPAMVLWGLMGCVATFSVALVVERSQGTLLRLRAAPVSRATLLGGKAAAALGACVVSAALLAALGVGLFGVHFDSPPKFIAALLATALCFCGLTVLLGTLGRSEQAVAGAGWSTLIVMAMLGGAMVPPALMPEWLLSVSHLSPVRWAIEALEGATFRKDSWAELRTPLALLVGLGATAFAAGALRMQIEER
jgi:hypothetical protein